MKNGNCAGQGCSTMYQVRVCLFIFFSAYGAQSDQLSHYERFFIGALAGCATTAAIEPLVYIKNRLQQGKEVFPDRSISLRTCRAMYRGLTVSAAGFVPTMAIQNAVFPFIQEQLKDAPLEEAQKKIIAAIGAGAVSAAPCCPRELLIVHQQNNGGNFYAAARNIIQAHGCKTLFTRGLMPIALRNSSFAGFFFGVTPYFDQKIKLYTSNRAMQILAPSMLAGVCSVLVTAPLDTVKTRMHAELGEKRARTIIHEIYNGLPKATKTGLPAFCAGLAPRMVAVPLTMCLEYNFRNYFTEKYIHQVRC